MVYSSAFLALLQSVYDLVNWWSAERCELIEGGSGGINHYYGVPSRHASKMGPDDLRQHVVADLRGFADFAGNGGAVAAGLFRMNVDEGERLLSRILRPGARG
jgi:hypothetical protein